MSAVLATGVSATTLAAGPAIADPVAQPADAGWSAYNNGYDGQRFSPLSEINPRNAHELKTVCSVALGDPGPFQAGPLVIGDALFVTTAHTTVALDATDCSVRWRHEYVPEEDEVWIVNRGAGYLNGRLYRGTTDGRILALDAQTGKLLWKVKAGEPAGREYFAAAPLVWNGMVFIGLAGSDWGIRGRMMAFDTDTGKELWRFNTIPVGDEIGADTWKNPQSALTGGGGTWSSYALDPSAGELFVPVANPAPDYFPSYRPGDNLFTNSLVVLDARTGALKWWYQVGANDAHDWDLAAPPAVYKSRGGKGLVALGSKDGHVYAIDRTNHQLVFKTAVTRIENSDKPPTPEGVHVCPGAQAGVHWNGPAIDTSRNSIFAGSVDWCGLFKSDPNTKYEFGEAFNGGVYVADATPPIGWVTALDATSGSIKWRYRSPAPIVAGITPTAGGVLFTGDLNGDFLVLDSESGAPLLKHPTGGAIAGGVITYSVGGKQYVATTSGNISRVSFKSTGLPKIEILALNVKPVAQRPMAAPATEAPESARSVVDINWGKILFNKNCAACHGVRGEGGTGPSLKDLAARRSFADTVAQIVNPMGAMPRLYPSPLEKQDVDDVASYVRTF